VTPGTIANDAVLVLDAELERRIAAAARVVDVAPTEFIVRAIQQRCAEVLGEQWRSGVSPDTPGHDIISEILYCEDRGEMPTGLV